MRPDKEHIIGWLKSWLSHAKHHHNTIINKRPLAGDAHKIRREVQIELLECEMRSLQRILRMYTSDESMEDRLHGR